MDLFPPYSLPLSLHLAGMAALLAGNLLTHDESWFVSSGWRSRLAVIADGVFLFLSLILPLLTQTRPAICIISYVLFSFLVWRHACVRGRVRGWVRACVHIWNTFSLCSPGWPETWTPQASAYWDGGCRYLLPCLPLPVLFGPQLHTLYFWLLFLSFSLRRPPTPSLSAPPSVFSTVLQTRLMLSSWLCNYATTSTF